MIRVRSINKTPECDIIGFKETGSLESTTTILVATMSTASSDATGIIHHEFVKEKDCKRQIL
jgi:hypothetical protein